MSIKISLKPTLLLLLMFLSSSPIVVTAPLEGVEEIVFLNGNAQNVLMFEELGGASVFIGADNQSGDTNDQVWRLQLGVMIQVGTRVELGRSGSVLNTSTKDVISTAEDHLSQLIKVHKMYDLSSIQTVELTYLSMPTNKYLSYQLLVPGTTYLLNARYDKVSVNEVKKGFKLKFLTNNVETSALTVTTITKQTENLIRMDYSCPATVTLASVSSYLVDLDVDEPMVRMGYDIANKLTVSMEFTDLLIINHVTLPAVITKVPVTYTNALCLSLDVTIDGVYAAFI